MELRLLLGTEPGLWAAALALALTYLAHSAVWAGAVALLASSKALSLATGDAYWKAALFGPLLSAGLATSALRDFSSRLFDGSSFTGFASAPPGLSAAGRLPVHSAFLDVVASSLPSGRTLALIGLVSIGAGVLRFGASVYLLHRSLRSRVLVTDPGILDRFARLSVRMKLGPVKLTESTTLHSPLVIGVAEVCVPRRLFSELPAADMDAVLAHELAHVERRDGVWFPLVAAVQSTLWLQPLNHLVSARFRDSAELACDDRAVELTGSPLGLARALVHVAERASQVRPPLFVPTMVRRRSALVPRVRRLTKASEGIEPRAHGRGRWKALLTLLVVGAASAALSVRVAGADRKSLDAPARKAAEARFDVGEQNGEMAALAAREQALVKELFALETGSRAGLAGAPGAVRALELAQELRHVRAMQAWREERFVEEWAAFDSRTTAHR